MSRFGQQSFTSQCEFSSESAPSTSPGRRPLAVASRAIQLKRSVGSAAAAGDPDDLNGANGQAPLASGLSNRLPDALRQQMEQSFSADFSGVTIQSGEQASAIGAQAFASGDELHFAPGQYDPDSQAGRELIGHELAHVIQQRAGRVSAPQNKGGVVVDAALEGEADIAGARAAAGQPVQLGGSDQMISRSSVGGSSAGFGGAIQRRVLSGPATPVTLASIEAMTVDAFLALGRDQADWSVQIAEPEKSQLQQFMMRLTRETAISTGAGGMHVGPVRRLAGPDRTAFDKYCQAVDSPAAPATATLAATDVLGDALTLGRALIRLEALIGGTCLHHIASSESMGNLVNRGLLDSFVDYVQACHPVLQVKAAVPGSGAKDELKSFMTFPAGALPPYRGRIPQVRNLHRFEQAALNTLATNHADRSKKKPVMLILHSALDHNGAFHQDPQLTRAIQHPRNLTLMIEGKETLEEVSGQLGPIAREYGQDDRIEQVMIAGHGDSRVIELAGTVRPGTDPDTGAPAMEESHDALDLDRTDSPERVTAFFQELLRHVGPRDPTLAERLAGTPPDQSRVLFNACLTGSNDIALDPASAVSPSQQIQTALQTNGSLMTTLQNMANTTTNPAHVMGANASFGSVSLINASGQMELSSTVDPSLSAPKLEYIRTGAEPTGVMRAILELWQDPSTAATTPDWLTAMRSRLGTGAGGDWSANFINTMVNIVDARYQQDPFMIRSLAALSTAVDHLKHENVATVQSVEGWLNTVPAEKIAIFEGLARSSSFRNAARRVILQLWTAVDASKGADLVTVLGFSNTEIAETSIDFSVLTDAIVAPLLPLASAASPSDGQLVLAILNVTSRTPHPSAISFLQRVLGTNSSFPATVDLARLAPNRGEQRILTAIGRASGGGGSSGGGPVAANLDRNQDGTNETRVDPMSQQGTIARCNRLNVRATPSLSSGVRGTVADGDSVYVYGRSRDWLAIEFRGRTGFIHERYVDLT